MKKAPEAQPAHPKHLGEIQTLEFQNVAFKHQTAHSAPLTISASR